VHHVRNQLPASNRLLEKYQYQYKLHRRYESEEEEYEHRIGRTLGRRQAICEHWHCPFFKYCWNSGMSRLPNIDYCLECRPRGRQPGDTSVFQRLGPKARHDDHVERPPRGFLGGNYLCAIINCCNDLHTIQILESSHVPFMEVSFTKVPLPSIFLVTAVNLHGKRRFCP